MSEFNLDTLEDMDVILKGKVSTVSKYDIDDANKGGFLWLTKPNNGENANILGEQIIKVTMPFEMFQFCKTEVEAGRFIFPGVFEVSASVVSGSGLKSGHKAKSIKQIATLHTTAQSMTASPKATPIPKPDSK
jgi:hypothetical protein